MTVTGRSTPLGTRPNARASASLAAAAARAFNVQRDRWPLMYPLALLLGAAWWMTALSDPPTAPILVVSIVCALGIALALRVRASDAGPWRAGLVRALVLLLCLALGALAAIARTALSDTPRLDRTFENVVVTGYVLDAAQGVERPRMTMRVVTIEDGEALIAAAPARVTLSTLPGAAIPPGRAVSCRAHLSPPEGPMAPHGYDAARRAYFERVGGTGFTLGRCRPIAPPTLSDPMARLEVQMAAWRRALTEAIFAAAPNDGGAVGAALVTGDRSLMSEAAVVAFRDSGLGHMLSVSGLHMSLVGGGVFAGLWLLFALIPKLALFAPIKKWAAIGALLALALYLVVSGVSVPAVRSFVMAAVAFGAVLIDRPAISVRGLAAALAAVVLLTPEAVVEPGFQMSFAATGALVAYFEAARKTPGLNDRAGLVIGAIQWGWSAVAGVLLISLVAGLATDPFAMFHFQRLTLYALPANLAVAPITSFVVAPAALAAAVLAPFGWADAPLRVMADALLIVVGIGRMFADRPEAVISIAAAPASALSAAIVGMTWLFLWRGWVRWLGLLGFPVAVALTLMQPPAVAAFDGDARMVVFLDQARAKAESAPAGDTAGAQADNYDQVTDGTPAWRAYAPGRPSAFAAQRLGALVGLSPLRASLLETPERCQPPVTACPWTTSGGAAVIATADPDVAAALCQTARVVILSGQVDLTPSARAACDASAIVIGPADRQEQGGGLIRIDAAGQVTLERARDWSGRRPWTGPLSRSDE